MKKLEGDWSRVGGRKKRTRKKRKRRNKRTRKKRGGNGEKEIEMVPMGNSCPTPSPGEKKEEKKEETPVNRSPIIYPMMPSQGLIYIPPELGSLDGALSNILYNQQRHDPSR